MGKTRNTGNISTNNIISVDIINDRVGINSSVPVSTLNVGGNITAEEYYGSGSSLTGIVTTIIAGNNITISGSTGSITIDSEGGGGGGDVSIINDETTNQTYYVGYSTQTSGTISQLNVAENKLTFNPSTGTLSATVFNSLSDQSQKTNIRPIENALEKISQLNGVYFQWRETQDTSIGVIAQQLEKIFPELVTKTSEYKSVNYNGLVGVLIECIKNQQEQINLLSSEIKNLK